MINEEEKLRSLGEIAEALWRKVFEDYPGVFQPAELTIVPSMIDHRSDSHLRCAGPRA